MVSWLEELERREAVVRDRIAEPRGQIEELTVLLVEQEGAVSRLKITRETMSEILSADGSVTGPETDDRGAAEPAKGPVAGVRSPVGVRLVSAWSVELDARVLPSSYRAAVEVRAVDQPGPVAGPGADQCRHGDAFGARSGDSHDGRVAAAAPGCGLWAASGPGRLRLRSRAGRPGPPPSLCDGPLLAAPPRAGAGSSPRPTTPACSTRSSTASSPRPASTSNRRNLSH